MQRYQTTLHKFSEQLWLCLWHAGSCAVGLGLMWREKYWGMLWGDREAFGWLWKGYPVRDVTLTPEFKLFYLTQLAYWIHHMLYLCYELYMHHRYRVRQAREAITMKENGIGPGPKKLPPPPRPDAAASMIHHVLTIALVVASYMMNFTRMGHVTMTLMDVADIWLPAAKVTKYAPNLSHLSTPIFGIFTLSWFITRHYHVILLLHSIIVDPFLHISPKYRFFDPWGTGAWWSYNVWYGFIAMFVVLELLMVLWGAMVVKVIYKVVVVGEVAGDVRSDGEESDVGEGKEGLAEGEEKERDVFVGSENGSGKAKRGWEEGSQEGDGDVWVEEVGSGGVKKRDGEKQELVAVGGEGEAEDGWDDTGKEAEGEAGAISKQRPRRRRKRRVVRPE
ncbi:sphingosine N-acyltransferase lag1 [Rhizophlyctis rosea]|nr:sphingosine N-acyltransferase lag1 [Rhizophlyctis rosea]